MTQEDKKLLIKDLNVRLPYGIYVEHTTTKIRGRLKGIVFDHIYNDTDSIQDINAWVMFFGDEYVDATYFRPILRPMSSMTEEEANEFETISEGLFINEATEKIWSEVIDWLNSHHFDYRGLIEKGLAIEASENIYNIKYKH